MVLNLHIAALDFIFGGYKDEMSKQDVKDRFHLCHRELHTHASLNICQDLSLVVQCRKAYSGPS